MKALAIAVAAAALAACSLDFSIVNLPCGPGDTCRPGYNCVNGGCIPGAPTKTCPECPSGFGCDATTGVCSTKICDGFRQCGQGKTCAAGACVAVPAGQPGDACTKNTDCAAGMCLTARASPPAKGYCAVNCTDPTACAAFAYTSCIPLVRTGGATTVPMCLPADLFQGCASDSECTPWGLTCQVFTAQIDATTLDGVYLCGAPVGSLANGAACTMDAECDSAICIRPGAAAMGTCSAPCTNASTDCAEGAFCARYRLDADATPTVCLPPPGPTLCNACQTSATCGIDAPDCARVGNGPLFCTATCTDDAPCTGLADGWGCSQSSGGATGTCAPTAFSCPMQR